MFNRAQWWPLLGFEKTIFASDFFDLGVKHQCGSTFRGVCDGDQINYIEKLLASNDKRKFVYGLTLNSHFPFPKVGIVDEEKDSFPNIDNTVFSLMSLWQRVFSAVSNVALSQNIKPTLFVIVGDHSPPFWSKENSTLMSKKNVPYIILRPIGSIPSI